MQTIVSIINKQVLLLLNIHCCFEDFSTTEAFGSDLSVKEQDSVCTDRSWRRAQREVESVHVKKPEFLVCCFPAVQSFYIIIYALRPQAAAWAVVMSASKRTSTSTILSTFLSALSLSLPLNSAIVLFFSEDLFSPPYMFHRLSLHHIYTMFLIIY